MTSNQMEFYLNTQQVDYIQMKLPQGFSLHLSSLVHQREQRISKKVSKFDATFKSNKLEQMSQEDQYQKRPQRMQAPFKNEQKGSDNKGVKLLQKFKSHQCFDEVYDTIADKFDIENVEAQIHGNAQNLQNDLKKFFKIATQVNQKNGRLMESINQLENHYCDLFKLPSMKKKPPVQQQQQQQAQQQQIQQQQTQQIQSKMQKPMTFQEKLNLGDNIRMLKPEYLRGVWEIVQESVQATGDEELEFDIDVLPLKVARKLEQYVSSKIQKKQKPNEEEEKSIDPESSDQ